GRCATFLPRPLEARSSLCHKKFLGKEADRNGTAVSAPRSKRTAGRIRAGCDLRAAWSRRWHFGPRGRADLRRDIEKRGPAAVPAPPQWVWYPATHHSRTAGLDRRGGEDVPPPGRAVPSARARHFPRTGRGDFAVMRL